MLFYRNSLRQFTQALKRTSLYNCHLQLKGKIIPFAGYELPVNYQDIGILKEHLHCRSSCSIFDVSHMGQLKITGKNSLQFLDYLLVGDILGLENNSGCLSLITNEKGGINDDTIVVKFPDHIFMVVNAACKDNDLAWILRWKDQLKSRFPDVSIECQFDSHSQIAVQGPKAELAVQRFVKEDLNKVKFMNSIYTKFDNLPALICRTGYTGEDGFEISMENKYAEKIWQRLAEQPEIKPAGLGSRDSLRLESGLCLYGHDMNENISPIEASLLWTVAARKKEKFDDSFIGQKPILEQKLKGVTKKRVGFMLPAGSPSAREEIPLFVKGQQVGHVTSGTQSPVLKQPVGMCYLNTSFTKVIYQIQLKTQVDARIRGKDIVATVTKMPFVPTNYKK